MKKVSNIFILFITILFFTQTLFAAEIDWEKIMQGIHANKGMEKSFGGSAGGKFTGNAYLDLDLLPPYGKAGIEATGSVFIKDVHTWEVLKAEGYIEGGLNIKTSLNTDSEELIITFSAGADAIIDLDFLKNQIYYYNANEKRLENGKNPLIKEWEIPIKVTKIMPLLESMGEELGIGAEGAFQLLADAATETVKILIKESTNPDHNLIESIGKLLANYFYNIASLKLNNQYKDEVELLIQKRYSSQDILNAIDTGSGSGELSKIAAYKRKKAIIGKLFWSIKFLLNFTNADKRSKMTVKLEKQYKWEKRLPGYSNTIIIGIVPIKIKFGGSAAIGANLSVGVESDDLLKNKNSKFFINIGPFASAGAYASAAVNLIIAKGGVEGTVDLIEDQLALSLEAPFPKIWSDIDGSIKNTLTTLKGKMSAFVSWKEIKIGKRVCKKRWKWKRWKFYKKYSCKWEWWHVYWKDKKASKTLLKFNGPKFQFKYKLF